MRKGDDMDMNWQAMLHEAANASFEKDIEVRAAADCVQAVRQSCCSRSNYHNPVILNGYGS